MAKQHDSSSGDAQQPQKPQAAPKSPLSTNDAPASESVSSSAAPPKKRKKRKKAATEAARTQGYDNLLKRLVEHQAEKLLPFFFPGKTIVRLEELTVELLIPPRRGDRVYKAYLRRADGTLKAVILQVEFEASDNQNMDKRLHVYHDVLYEKYGLPVRSLLVYPFEVKGVSPPLVERDDDEIIDIFYYSTLPLFKESAEKYIAQGAVPMYGLLPVMQDTSDELLLKAIDAMVHYYGDKESLLRDELLCFRVLFKRAHRLPPAEMVRVERRLRMFDPLLENDPWVQEKLAEREARGLAKGEARGETRGELKAARDFVTNLVRRRFPDLAILAEVRALQLEKPESLTLLFNQLVDAPDEQTARVILETFPNS